MKRIFLLFCLLFSCFEVFSQFEWVVSTPSMVNPNSITSQQTVVDSLGNAYTCGSFYGTIDFDPGAGNASRIAPNNWDAYVTKFDSEGNFVWVLTFGATAEDRGLGIAIDQNQNLLVTGTFNNTVDFDPGAGSYPLTAIVSITFGFAVKLDAGGNFLWAKSFESSAGSIVQQASFGADLSCYIIGRFTNDVDLDPGTPVDSYVISPYGGSFVVKLDEDGNYLWGRGFSEQLGTHGIDIAQDSGCVIAGEYGGTCDFDPGSGVYTLTAQEVDIFILKLTASGEFDWVKGFGGPSNDAAYLVETSVSGNYYLSGVYSGTVDFNPSGSPAVLSTTATVNTFVLKLNDSGDFQWVKSVAGNFNIPLALVSGPDESITIGGYFNYQATFNQDVFDASWSYDGYVWCLEQSGSPRWVFNLPGTLASYVEGLAQDSNGNLYISGEFFGPTDFAPGPTVYTISGQTDDPSTFLMKISSTLSLQESVGLKTYSIFPNPVSDILTVQGMFDQTQSIDIYELTGMKVRSTWNSNAMDVSGLSAGTYLLVRNGEAGNGQLFVKE